MKRAVLTGASSGLGRATAFELLRNGYEVALLGRNRQALEEIAAGNPAARMVVADLGIESEVSGLIERCQKEFGDEEPITHLVNCAGFAVTGRVEDIPSDLWDRSWRVNFSSAVSLSQQVIPMMIKAGHGLIANVTSGVARRALPFVSPYCAAKAALNSFTDSLRVELAPKNVRVLMFSPGPVISNFHAASIHCGKTRLINPPFHGKEAAVIGKRLFQALEQREERVTIGGKANLAHHLNYWFPRLTDRIIGKACRLEPT